MAQKKLKLYALSTCPTCRKTAAYLDELGVEYEKIEVDLLPGGEQWLMSKELKQVNPEGTYPTLVVQEIIVGLDKDRIRQALGL